MENTEAKTDIIEQVAIVQRDKETYAIAPHIPGGITDANTLRKIADVSDKYNCKALKLTSAQRIALVGIAAENIEDVWRDLGMEKGQAIGLCVRSVKICPGTTFCKRAKQDSVSLGLALDKRYHGRSLPSKLKIGVSGCPNNCAESCVKDIGFMGSNTGYTVMIGGYASGTGRLAEVICTDKSEQECLELTEKIIDVYEKVAKRGQRLGRLLNKVGTENFLRAVESSGDEYENNIQKLIEANA